MHCVGICSREYSQLVQAMSSSNLESKVVKKTHNTRAQTAKDQNLQRAAEGSLANSKAANEELPYVQPNSSGKADAHASDQNPEIQPQSKPEYSPQDSHPNTDGPNEAAPVDMDVDHSEPQDNHPTTDDLNEAAPVESNGTGMDIEYSGPQRDLSEPPNPRTANNGMNPGGPAPIDVDDDEYGEVLNNLKTLSNGQDQDGVPDAWSRLGRSRVLLVRYGPYKAAKYRVQTANGYNTTGLQKVSDLETRISHITYRGQDGEKHKRYTRNNVTGIVGVAIKQRNNQAKEYKIAPVAYVKIKWEGIDEADQKLLTRNTCWITNADLITLTDQATAAQKISEAWEKQEQRYNDRQSQIGRGSPDRSPSPCPLDTFKAGKDRTLKRERTNEPFPNFERGEDALSPTTHPDHAGRRPAGQPAANISEGYNPVPIKQELNSVENELFVSVNGQNANDLDNNTSSGPGQSRPPPKLSKFYMKWLKRRQLEQTDLNNLDDEYIARFEAAAFVYVDELRKQGYIVEDDMGADL